MSTPVQNQNHSLTHGEAPKPKILEGAQFHPEAIKARSKDALRPRRLPATAWNLGKKAVAVTGLYAVATGSVPPGVESASNFVREKGSEAAVGVGNMIGDVLSPDGDSSDSQPNGDVPQSLLADLQSRMPEGTKIVDAKAQPGDGPWSMVKRANPGLSDPQLATAVQYTEARPDVQDGIGNGEPIGIPNLPEQPAPPHNQGQ